MVFDPLQLNLLAQIQTPQSIYTEQAFQFNESETRLYCSCLLQNRLVAFDCGHALHLFSPVQAAILWCKGSMPKGALCFKRTTAYLHL